MSPDDDTKPLLNRSAAPLDPAQLLRDRLNAELPVNPSLSSSLENTALKQERGVILNSYWDAREKVQNLLVSTMADQPPARTWTALTSFFDPIPDGSLGALKWKWRNRSSRLSIEPPERIGHRLSELIQEDTIDKDSAISLKLLRQVTDLAVIDSLLSQAHKTGWEEAAKPILDELTRGRIKPYHLLTFMPDKSRVTDEMRSRLGSDADTDQDEHSRIEEMELRQNLLRILRRG